MAGQAADEGRVRVGAEPFLDGAVDGGEPVAGGKRLAGDLADHLGAQPTARNEGALRPGGGDGVLGQCLDAAQVGGGLEDAAGDARRPGGTDLVGRRVEAEKDEAGLGGDVDAPLERWEERGQQIADAPGAPGLIDDEVAPARDQQPELGVEFAGRLDGAQVAPGPGQLGNHRGVFRIALGLAAARALPGTVHGQARRVHDGDPGLGQHRREQARHTAEHVEGDDRPVGVDRLDARDQRGDRLRVIGDRKTEQRIGVLVDRRGPVDLLGDVDADEDGHGHLPASCTTSCPRPPSSPYIAMDRTA
jgi:hypothetical protein